MEEEDEEVEVEVEEEEEKEKEKEKEEVRRFKVARVIVLNTPPTSYSISHRSISGSSTDPLMPMSSTSASIQHPAGTAGNEKLPSHKGHYAGVDLPGSTWYRPETYCIEHAETLSYQPHYVPGVQHTTATLFCETMYSYHTLRTSTRPENGA
jgi:hypothetical protein